MCYPSCYQFRQSVSSWATVGGTDAKMRGALQTWAKRLLLLTAGSIAASAMQTGRTKFLQISFVLHQAAREFLAKSLNSRKRLAGY